MRLETFFEKFELFADAPDAVAKMRELVLELAVQGKLIPQDSSDEPASKQLERIAAKKTRMERTGRRQRDISSKSAAEIPQPDLPDGWISASLADLVTVLNGRAYSKDELLAAGTPVLRVGNLFTSKDWYYSNLELEPDKYCDKGDLLFAWSASFGPFLWSGPKVIFHYHIWKLEPHCAENLDKVYLYWFLQNRTQEIKRSGHGVSMLHMTKEKMERLPMAVPPLAEQKRIVAKVVELMALCGQLEALQQERETRHAALARAALDRFAEAPTTANLNFIFHKAYDIEPGDLRKAILTLAVQGKLVERSLRDEPIDGVLEDMQRRRQRLVDAKKIRKPQVLPQVTEDELPFIVPGSWRWVRWGQICDWITYGFTRPMSHVKEGPPIVTAKNVQDGFMTFENTHRAEPSEFAALNPKDLPRKGDILITKDGTIGRAAIVETDEPFCINQSVAVLWLESCLLYRPYMLMVLRSPSAQGPIWEAAEGMAIKHLSITDFGQMILPVPPVAEQRRIVAKVDQLMALVDHLEEQLAASRATAAKLLDALVAVLTANA